MWAFKLEHQIGIDAFHKVESIDVGNVAFQEGLELLALTLPRVLFLVDQLFDELSHLRPPFLRFLRRFLGKGP